jgi:hypothetical protein
VDDRTRVSASLLSSSDGNVNLSTGANSYSGFFTFDQGFDTGKLGTQRIGAYAFVGEAATYYKTDSSGGTGAVPIPGSGIGNKSFSRVGFYGQFYLGRILTSTLLPSTARITRGSGRDMATQSPQMATAVRRRHAQVLRMDPIALRTIHREQLFRRDRGLRSGMAIPSKLATSIVRS